MSNKKYFSLALDKLSKLLKDDFFVAIVDNKKIIKSISSNERRINYKNAISEEFKSTVSESEIEEEIKNTVIIYKYVPLNIYLF